MDAARVGEVLARLGQPAYRLRQLLDAVYGRGVASYAEVTTLPAPVRAALAAEAPLLSLEPARLAVSHDGRAHKAALRLKDGLLVESVLLKPVPGDSWTTCISTQVGCAMGCTFCATGLMGLSRNLSPEEITDQVLFWRQYLASGKAAGRLTNVVYMGMGEPFHAYAQVAASLKTLMDPAAFGLSARRIAVSTVGIAPAIERFAEEFPNVNLALSLHAAEDALRQRLVPANRAYPLKKLARALARYTARTGRRVFLEYVLLAGENDGPGHAERLAAFVRSAARPDLLHVNLIVWNPTDTPHRPAAAEDARAFRDRLRELGVSVTIRKNLGTDIQGACGQLITPGAAPKTSEAAFPRPRARSVERRAARRRVPAARVLRR